MPSDEGCYAVQFSVFEDLDIQEFELGSLFVLDIVDIYFLFGGLSHGFYAFLNDSFCLSCPDYQPNRKSSRSCRASFSSGSFSLWMAFSR